MIIDLILDRKDGHEYSARAFYSEVVAHSASNPTDSATIATAFRLGKEKMVRFALCNYIRNNGYNEEICEYINSVEWLDKSRDVTLDEDERDALSYAILDSISHLAKLREEAGTNGFDIKPYQERMELLNRIHSKVLGI